jgi:preprotein translocase subunit Sss1
MKEYVEILTAVLMTVITIGVVGFVSAGFYMIYKTIKEDY